MNTEELTEMMAKYGQLKGAHLDWYRLEANAKPIFDVNNDMNKAADSDRWAEERFEQIQTELKKLEGAK